MVLRYHMLKGANNHLLSNYEIFAQVIDVFRVHTVHLEFMQKTKKKFARATV